METIIFVGIVLSTLLLFFVFTSPQNTKHDKHDKHLFNPAKKIRPFYNMKKELKIADNGGTRLGVDRRQFHYTAYIPEKRSGLDRRKGLDRRSKITQKRESERRSSLNNQGPHPIERRDIFRKQS